jgi:hypothetical protein
VSRRDRAEALAVAARRTEIERQLSDLVTRELVDEHRARSRGTHSPALTIILSYFRQAPVRGKLALLAVRTSHTWRLVELSGEQGIPHRVVDREFAAESEAAHAAFLRRLSAIGVDVETAATADE